MTGSGASPTLDVYDIAYLAGGSVRVVDTAIVALLQSGRLRLHAPGSLATAELSRRHPIEAAVLDAVGPTGHRSVDTVHWRMLHDDRLLQVGRRLQDRGLLARHAGVAGLRAGRRELTPTRAGRQALAAAGDAPGVDADAMRVALGGRSAMLDVTLRTAVFEPPRTPPVVPPRRRRSPRDYSDDPQVAAYYAGAAGLGGGLVFGATGGFDGGGGGDGGGDGG